MTNQSKKWRPSGLPANLLLLFGTLVMMFLAAEIGVRAIQRAVRGTPFMTLLPRYTEVRFPLSPFLVFGPRVDWKAEGQPYSAGAYFNRQGFRTEGEVPTQANGEFRIITLGGSTTENLWNRAGLHWPGVLEEELRSAGLDTRILNGAMSAYTTAHSTVRYLTDAIEYQPKVMILMHNINDLSVTYAAAEADSTPDPSYLIRYGAKSMTGALDEDDIIVSRALHFIKARLAATTSGPPRLDKPYRLDEGLRLFKRNLGMFVDLVRANDTEVVLLTMPVADDNELYARTETLLPDRRAFLRDFDAFNAAIIEVAEAKQVPVIDMAAALSGRNDLFVDVVHYNEDGVRTFGSQLAKELTPVIENMIAGAS